MDFFHDCFFCVSSILFADFSLRFQSHAPNVVEAPPVDVAGDEVVRVAKRKRKSREDASKPNAATVRSGIPLIAFICYPLSLTV